MATKTFASGKEAVERGRTSDIYPRLDAGVANMQQYISILEKHRGYIPLAFLIVKGAWESKGTAYAQSASLRDVGLFQLLLSEPKGSKAGYTFDQLKNPEINTKVYTDIAKKNAEGFLRTHGSYFPEGSGDWQFWGVQWLSSGIGPHATRTLLNAIPAGANAFTRLVSFVANNPEWLEDSSRSKDWGVQSPRLVVFRTILGKRIVDYMKKLEPTLPVSSRAAASVVTLKGSKWPVAVGGVVLAATLAGLSILYLERRRGGAMGFGSNGAPTHMARMVLSPSKGHFKNVLKKAKKCGSVNHACTEGRDPWGRSWETCTWRLDGKLVAAMIAEPRSAGKLRGAAFWTDRELLSGRCPR